MDGYATLNLPGDRGASRGGTSQRYSVSLIWMGVLGVRVILLTPPGWFFNVPSWNFLVGGLVQRAFLVACWLVVFEM